MRLFPRFGTTQPNATRKIAAFLIVVTLGLSTGASAQSGQSPADHQRQIGTYKMIAGGGLAAVGGLVLAASHQSASVNTGFGKISASATSMGGVVTGIGMLGAGGYLLYLGNKDRKDAAKSPSQNFVLELGKRKSITLVRQW